jgi:bifunctional non-homologous end joining protein LigD
MLASKPLGGKGINDYPVADWVLEEKFDGHRMIITTRSGQAPLAWSRVGNAKPLPEHLAREVMSNLPTGTFDGEIYVPGGTSTDVTALENTQLLQLVLFDVLLVENANVMQMDATARRQILQTAGAKLQGDFLSIAPQYVPSEGMLLKLWNRGGEGGILKRRDAVYEFGKRAKTWVKLKKQGSAVITVDRFERGLLGPHSVIIGHTDGGVSVSVKSLNDSWRAIFATRSTEFVGRRLVVAYQEQTRDGKLRHPMAEHFEEGGPAGPKLEIGTMR